MNIVHLITSIEKGGAENHLSCLARGQSKKNNVTIIYLKGKPYWKKYLNNLGIRVIKLQNKKNNIIEIIRNIFFLKNFFIKNKTKIVHSHLPHMEFYGWSSLFVLNSKVKFIILHYKIMLIG